MNDDGKSFSELKEEYDAGEADWADEDGADAPADEDEGDSFDDGDAFDDDLGDEADPFDDGTDSFDEEPPGGDDAAANGHEAEPEPEPATERGPAADRARGPQPGGDPAEANGGGFEYVGEDDLSGSRGKPYLTELPGDYVGDLLVMEWLEFLVSESDVTDAVRAINYYERIEWVGPAAAARLRDFLSGFGTIDRNLVDRPGTDRLVREHHTRSLRYVTQLNGTSGHLMLLDRWDDLARGSLVGGGPPPVGRGRGRDEREDRGARRRDEREEREERRRDGSHRDDAAERRADRRANGHGDARPPDTGTERGTEPAERGTEPTERDDESTERSDERNRGGDRPEGRDRNGGSPRPMNDPNPRSDRADPADGGWGDGR